MIPTHYKILAGAAIAVLCASGVWFYGEHRYAAGRAFEQGLQVKQEVKEERTNRTLEAEVTKDKDTSYDQYIKDRDVARADAARARDELGRLRDTVRALQQRAAAQGTTAERGTDAAAEVAELLERCGERHQAVADEAGNLAEQVIGLQGYIQSITPICVRQGE